MLFQFNEVHHFNYDSARKGFLLILWGFFQKLVIANRIAILVNTVYENPSKYYGLDSILAAVLFAFQLYCDFAGYSNIAIGVAEVMGFRLNTNFDSPYFSKSIKEFWRRWHISLGSWFKDYLYYPLGGNRCSTVRNCLNIMIVFAVCGLWHGASITFVIWGALHGLYQVIGILIKPLKKRLMGNLKISMESTGYHIAQTVATFVLVDFAWIFFRASTLKDAITMIQHMFQFDLAVFWNGTIFNLGLTPLEFWFGMVGTLFVIAVDAAKSKIDIRAWLLAQSTFVRWSVYLIAVVSIAILGVYGSNYGAQQFLYSKF
jgi:alginate O-acetyltransferase complex protein AlgI